VIKKEMMMRSQMKKEITKMKRKEKVMEMALIQINQRIKRNIMEVTQIKLKV
jgi:hypothetical protein